MLLSAFQKTPEIYPFLKQCYSVPTNLSFGVFTMMSQRGCQQGDPCGPPLFCLAIQEMVSNLNSDFNIWFLDDGSLGGPPVLVLNDLKMIIEKSSDLGLKLSFSKCEMMILGGGNMQEISKTFNAVAQGIVIKDVEIDLLGSPLTDSGIPSAIDSKRKILERMVDRLSKMNSHQAYYLLRNSLSIPKLSYLLRSTPCWHAMNELIEYDRLIKLSMERIINCQVDAKAWRESSLSVKCGGMGLRNVTNLCFSSFLGSFHSVYDLLQEILPPHIQLSVDLVFEASDAWQSITDKELLSNPASSSQHKWDDIICHSIQQEVFSSHTSDIDKARGLANLTPESSSWLNALPCSSLGTLLDDQSFRISVSLRLGIPICHPHNCICGQNVDKFGRHGLACRKSEGRKSKHEAINDLIKRALVTCGIPTLREPTGCNRSDGKRPDGLTLIPWQRGKPLIWDFTCADTLCQSYITRTRRQVGAAASGRESSTRLKYRSLENEFCFYPISIETMGPWGDDGKKLINEIGKKLIESTGEKRSKSFLIQRISIANQRGNAASIFGTLPQDTNKFDEIFYVI